VCDAGFLTNLAASHICDTCPDHLECADLNTTLPDLILHEAHWRPGYATEIARPCPDRTTCTGGTTPHATYNRFSNATCAPGRGVAGAYCLLCAQPTTHFFDTALHRCRACADTTGGAVALVVVLAVVTVAVQLLRRHPPAWLVAASARLVAQAARVSFRAKLRVVISFLQVATQLERVYDVRYPESFAALLNVFGIVNVDVHGWMPTLQLRCLGVRSLASQLLVMALVPLAVAAAAPLIAALRRRPPHEALPFVLGWTFLVFPSISSFGFRSLAPCDCFRYALDGDEVCFLRADYEVECTGWLFGRPAAPPDVQTASWTAIVLWAIGVPLVYAALLYTSRSATIGSKQATIAPRLRPALGTLVGDYRPNTSAWELVVVVEKLVLTGFLALLEPGTWTQLFVGVIAALFAFSLQARVAPYRSAGDNLFAYVASLSLVAVFLGTLGLQTQALGTPVSSGILLAVLFTFTLVVLFTASAFFLAELLDARRVLLVRSTKQPPTLTLDVGKHWHLFLSHNWANQDAVHTIKRQLQLLLPTIRAFLDVDDLDNVDALEAHIAASTAVLVFLGSPQYFASKNCLRELAASQSTPLVRVHDADETKGGAPLDILRAKCPIEHRERLFDGGEILPWHRVKDFQFVVLARIAEQLVHNDLMVQGALPWAPLTFRTPVRVYTSAHNPEAAPILAKLCDRYDGMHAAAEGTTHWLLCVSVRCFDVAALVEELEAADSLPAIVYEPAVNTFDAIIGSTPGHIIRRFFGTLAIEWWSGPLQVASEQSVAHALGARVDRCGRSRASGIRRPRRRSGLVMLRDEEATRRVVGVATAAHDEL